MKEAAEHIETTLSANAAIVSALTNGYYWELAPEGTDVPFATYSIQESPGRTKDMGGEFRASFFVWASNLYGGATIAETIKEEVPATWKFIQGASGYTSEQAKEAYIELVFTFKL